MSGWQSGRVCHVGNGQVLGVSFGLGKSLFRYVFDKEAFSDGHKRLVEREPRL